VYSIQTICEAVGGRFLQQADNSAITYLLYDSRRVQVAGESLFFALVTPGNDGHRFMVQAHKQGVRNFVVQQEVQLKELPESNIVLVPDTLQALQQLARFHRQHFQMPILGITGSNGKTVAKEWLYQLLSDDYNIVRSPKSFNSQIGVPLSVWGLGPQHTLGIFEAGISQPGEMAQLEGIIQPTIGVLTNIGAAHDEGFDSHLQKLEEKLRLFQQSDVVIGNEELLAGNVPEDKRFSWSKKGAAAVQVGAVEKKRGKTTISISHAGKLFQIAIPFTDEASIENAITCSCVLLYLKVDIETKAAAFSNLHAVDMRLHLMRGINNCTLINDSYSADLTSLHIALGFLQQQATAQKRTVILSDFVESGKTDESLYQHMASLVRRYKIEKLIGIGEKTAAFLPPLLPEKTEAVFYKSTEQFVQQFRSFLFNNEIILIKGARVFQFEQVVQLLEFKVHQTQLEINLNAIAHNLKQYQRLLKPGTKLMAMVKAFAYGSGGAEIASVLQFRNVDYLGVAYADEGIELRKAGITVPVMVLNVDESSFSAVIEYNLQPVLFSFPLLQQFEAYLNAQALLSWPVHLEIETGMNRLGFAAADTESLATHIATSTLLKIESVFTHLAASEEPAQDAFTKEQLQLFQKAIAVLQQAHPYPFLKHISNSAAISRHPELQLDMVRLGIGLYGIESNKKLDVQPAATLRSTIAQIKYLTPGESVSYNRRGVVTRNSVIATVRIGYADGYFRRFGNGVGKMLVHGRLAPVIGTVCMDMTMLDVTDIADVKEGDDVILFGAGLPVQQVAAWIETIPYEIMTGISQRVKRIYFQE
jgi:alanine racemase